LPTGGCSASRARRPSRAFARKELAHVAASGRLVLRQVMRADFSASVQRRAISRLFSASSGRSANSSRISAADFRYCLGRVVAWPARVVERAPWAMQQRVSCDSKSSRRRKRTSLVATTGSEACDASVIVARRCAYVLRASTARDLQIEAISEDPQPLRRGSLCLIGATREQCTTDLAVAPDNAIRPRPSSSSQARLISGWPRDWPSV